MLWLRSDVSSSPRNLLHVLLQKYDEKSPQNSNLAKIVSTREDMEFVANMESQ